MSGPLSSPTLGALNRRSMQSDREGLKSVDMPVKLEALEPMRLTPTSNACTPAAQQQPPRRIKDGPLDHLRLPSSRPVEGYLQPHPRVQGPRDGYPLEQAQANQEQAMLLGPVPRYLRLIKDHFWNRPKTYDTFVNIMRYNVPARDLVPNVALLFESAPHLVQEFKNLILLLDQGRYQQNQASVAPSWPPPLPPSSSSISTSQAVATQHHGMPSRSSTSHTIGNPRGTDSNAHSTDNDDKDEDNGNESANEDYGDDDWDNMQLPNGDWDQFLRYAQRMKDEEKGSQQEDIQKLLSLPEIDIPPDERKNTPAAMSCKLLEHQKVCLTWLMEQEDSHKKGGLLADTMGLGKTVQALALIVARPSKNKARKTTLIVAPLALLKQWQREIQTKVHGRYKLSTHIYHERGKRGMTVDRLLTYDVVLTTYGTITSEYKQYLRQKESRRGLILLSSKAQFHRIILDEAHNIKNRKAKVSMGVTELSATYRLCMTGTPFMNRITEIFPLIRFLGIPPYMDWVNFNQDIEKPLKGWDKDEQGYAMRKLQTLFRSFTLRRTKTSTLDGQPILVLPERTVEVARAEFNEDQQAFYTALEQRQQLKLNKYLRKGRSNRTYAYILVLLLRLRQACDHPHLIKDHDIPDGATLSPKEMVKLAQMLPEDVVESIRKQVEFHCPLCDITTQNPMIIDRCGHFLCGDCFSGMMVVRSSEGMRGEGDESPAFCAHEGCNEEVLPDRVLCYDYFMEAHMTDMLDNGAGDDDVEKIWESSDNNASDMDGYGNLKGFVVSDGEDLDEEKKNRKLCKRRPNHRGIASLDDEEDEEGEEKDEKDQSNRARHADNRCPTFSDDEDGDNGEGSDYSGNGESSASLGKATSDIVKKENGPKEEDPADDSDADSLPPLDDLWKDAAKKARANPDHLDIDDPAWHIFLRIKDPTPASGAKRKVKKEDDEDVKSTKKVKITSKCTGNFRKSQGKGKKKKAPTSLAELKKASATSAAAKAKYLTKLRENYVSSAKIDKTMEILCKIREEKPKEKTLLFSLWTSFLDLLEIPIYDEGFGYRRYDGSMTATQRDSAVREFMEKPDVKVLLVSLMAGNAGLNLTAASEVIVLEPFWNPFVEDQAVDRAHRIGQKKPVTVHRVLVKGTVEDRILDLQEKKRELVNTALSEEGAQGVGRLSMQELRGLFGLR